ncbi:MAG: alpha/beta hydrolase [Bacteroidota bacterium]
MNVRICFLLIYLATALTTQAQEVVIPHNELEIGGTLVVPDHASSSSLVIMLSGSGAQNRDSEVVGFKIFADVADHFKSLGIASFRFDDRGVASSTGSFTEASLNDLAGDVHRIMDYFRASDNHTYTSFILMGHSQGGMVAVRAAQNRTDIERLLLIASPMVPLKEIINEQIRTIQSAMGNPEEDIQKTLAFQDKMYEAIRTDSGWDDVQNAFVELLKDQVSKLPEAQRNSIPDVDALAVAQYNAQMRPMQSRQMATLLFYDVQADLKNLNIPMHAVFGEKDTQVSTGQNATVFDSVCAENQLTCSNATIPSANHLFQEAKTGMIQEYAMLPKELMPAFLAELAEVLKR